MVTKKYSILLLTVMLLSMLMFSACIAYKKPEFRSVSNLGIASFSADTIKLEADVMMYNPNGFSFKVKEVNMDAMISGIELKGVRQRGEVKIRGKQDFAIPISISLPTAKLFNNFLSAMAFAAKKKELDIQYTGNVKLKAYGIPYNIPVEYDGKVGLGSQ